MALLIDNDVVHKLAQMDLLEPAVTILKEKYGELKILNTLKFKFCHTDSGKRSRLEKRFTKTVIDRIEAFINSGITEVDCEITDEALITAMVSSDEGLDVGEMQLLQALIDGEESNFFTGDKRFLKALAASEKLSTTHGEKLKHCFVCFEQIMSFLIKSLGFDLVKQKYIQAKQLGLNLDSVLRACFGGSGIEALEANVQQSLGSYVSDLMLETIDLLSKSEVWSSGIDEYPRESVSAFSQIN